MILSCCVLYSKGTDLISWRKSLPKENIEVVACEIRFDSTLDEIKTEVIGSTEFLKALAITFPSRDDHFDFSLCRNFADEHATGKWILHVDSDERLAIPHDEFWEYIEAVDQSEAEAAYVSIAGITRENSEKRNLSYEQRYNNPNIRLHRKSANLKWHGICHETVEVPREGMTIADTEILLYHKGYAIEQDEMQKKLERNAKLMIREYIREKSERNWTYLIKTFSLIKPKGN